MSSTKIGAISAFCVTFTMMLAQDVISSRDIMWITNAFIGLGGVAVFFVIYWFFLRTKKVQP